jgi:beta-phosphoglucomutase family hydrolase
MNDKAVIFDLDGVLVDTGDFHKQAWYDLADKHEIEMTDELFVSTFGMQNYQIIPSLFDRALGKEEITEMSEWKEQRFREIAEGKISMLDGVEQLVTGLKQDSFKLAIGSSTTRSNIDFFLSNMSISSDIDDYVVGEDVTNGKPAPDTFLKAAEKLGVPAFRCVVFEDAVQGVQAGKSAGMKVIAVTTSRAREYLVQADVVIDSLADICAKDVDSLLDGI